ncbi:twin-arginine translocase TatA/TatE family subunit [Saccharolobus solfataricus]|uniref:Twin-arginine translocase TatA/TatE family subunit n=3 Tax=Saccharolobus solfataricus TaxID=2287 RepID=A0A0E3MKX7_SACSO|nr:twin-arginine translocase TatA/TatE family subunit [Saccharolobus solfataricus]AKA77764.2 twin-arginine translocase TatA/TatE family subunit [Saccharolobus solfataricus]AKA80457.2 twin-arginine translocase TatA/TatE family subunit [Saccharolobus solfataricus]AZF68252.1 twin-arginine translocase TatA/TatE family subunit [Saccharolobus solfataricus]AZF70872.1 twin-arginine translocase TatA/TatE family subunit [Saccharolobus solfataricus]
MKAKFLISRRDITYKDGSMFNNPYDWVILLVVVAVLFFGASKIPELFRSMGRAVGEFKKGRVEAEMELQQMQAQNLQQPSVQQQQPNVQDLEKQIAELQKQLEELKKSKQNQ